MKTKELMSRDVHTCTPEASLQEAARIMWERDVGCLVVTDREAKPVGMITDRDVAMAAYTKGGMLREMPVQSAMARHVVTCSVDASLGHLEELMRHARIRRVPVVDSHGRLVGIVTLGDVARSACAGPLHLPELPGLAKTLAAITAPRRHQTAAAE